MTYRSLSWIETYFLSSLASFTISLTIFLIYSKSKTCIFREQSIQAILAGILGSLGYVFFIKALERGKASIVIPLTALYPAITVVFALLLLKEKITVLQALGIVLALVATILMSL